jgi:hypothetical protein
MVGEPTTAKASERELQREVDEVIKRLLDLVRGNAPNTAPLLGQPISERARVFETNKGRIP